MKIQFQTLSDACKPICDTLGQEEDAGKYYAEILPSLPLRVGQYCREGVKAAVRRLMATYKLLWPDIPYEQVMAETTSEQETAIDALEPGVEEIATHVANRIELDDEDSPPSAE